MLVRIIPLCCPDVSGMLSGYFRNGCPDVTEICTNLNNLGISYAYGKSDKLETKNCSTITINNTGKVVPNIFTEQDEEEIDGS